MTAGHCSQERRSVRLLWASGRHIFINWSIHKCVLCVFLFKGTLFDTYCRFIHIERTVNSTVTHAYAKMNTCIFSMKHISLLVLWNTGRHASTTCGGHLNNEVANKKHKNAENGTLVYRMRVARSSGEEASRSTSSANVRVRRLRLFAALCTSMNDLKSVGVDFGLQINFAK